MNPSPRLSLHDWSCLRTELVWIYAHAPNPRSRCGMFDHRDGNWAWFICRGEVRVAAKSGELVARTGQWMLPPPTIHRHDFSDDAELISVRFRCRWPSGDNIFNTPEAAVLDGAKFPALEKTARRLERFTRGRFPGASHHQHLLQAADFPEFLRFQRLFFDWLEAWFEARVETGAILARSEGDERVARCVRLLDDAPLEAGFPSDALPKAGGLSAVQLTRLFRSELKLTPLQYWERRRLETARLHLETTDWPLKEVAAQLGFRSDSHFTVWFKRHMRVSPGVYREQPPQI
jgi:AraC-like DNA-binding protein